MNRPLVPRNGGVLLYPGRIYRLLLVVNGATSPEDLEDELASLGFDRTKLATSGPSEWPNDRPRDWPDEPALDAIAANECAVRVTGLFVGVQRTIGRDMPIANTEASFSVAAAWEYQVPRGATHAAGAVVPAPAPAPAAQGDRRGTAALLTGLGLLGFGLWASLRSQARLEKETERVRIAAQRDEEAAIALRRQELERLGHSSAEAEELATRGAEAQLPSGPAADWYGGE